MTSVTYINSRDGFFFLFAYLEKPTRNYCIQKTKMSISINDSFAGGSHECFQKSIRSTSCIPIKLIDLLCKRLVVHAYNLQPFLCLLKARNSVDSVISVITRTVFVFMLLFDIEKVCRTKLFTKKYIFLCQLQ